MTTQPDLAELRRLLGATPDGSPLPWRRIGCRVDGSDRFKVSECLLEEDAELIVAAVNALPALLDAAAERDALAALRATAEAIARAYRARAECAEGLLVDAGYRQGDRDALRVELAHMTEARDNARAEVERLAAKVERVRALADLIDRHTEFERDPVDFRDASHGGSWDDVADRIRRALDEEPQP